VLPVRALLSPAPSPYNSQNAAITL